MSTTRWNTLEYLRDEEEIAEYLKSALLDIEEGEVDVRFFFRCLTKVAQARAINQIVKDTGVDRQSLCELFLEDANNNDIANVEVLRENSDTILQAAKAFAVLAHA